MKTLRNMKIRSKFAVAFLTLFFVALTSCIIAVRTIRFTNADYSYLLSHPVERYNYLQNISSEALELRRISAMIVLSIGDSQALSTWEQEFGSTSSNLSALLNGFRANTNDDPMFTEAERNQRLQGAADLETLIARYSQEVIMPLLQAEDSEEAMQILRNSRPIFSEIQNTYSTMMQNAKDIVTDMSRELDASTRATWFLLIILPVTGGVISLVLGVIVSSMMSKSVTEIVDVVNEVSKGNFNVNIRADSTDEVGMLGRSMKNLVGTLTNLMQDMEHMAGEHANGNIDIYVNTEKYTGEYSTMANQINSMIQVHLDTLVESLSALREVAGGNFDLTIKQYPNKKALINEVFDEIKGNVVNVSNEINAVIKAASVDGDLAFSVDESKYNGGWKSIMQGLNAICKAVDDPIVEIRDAMDALKNGDFTATIKGDYTGDFLIIKNGMNSTIQTLSVYVHEIDDILGAIAAGDLTRTTSMDFVGDFSPIKTSLAKITSTLNKTMSEINSASAQVLSGAKQISISAMELANGASEQASSVEELTASIDMINQQTHQNAQNADDANLLSNKSSENAHEGNEAMKHMLEAMLQIKESSNSISRIIKVIQDIAFQTNLLSLNAAVEAARAGEHGKGFSVVAEEVRNLASRSQQAAQETTALIEDSISRVESGSEIAGSTAESLDTIVSNASEVLQIINNISVASKDQAEAVEQISIGLSQVSQVVQSNSAVSEETAAAAEELNSQAEILQQLVSYFKV